MRKYKMIMIGLLALSFFITKGQSFDVKFARWKGNASGAYTLILDDYGARYFGDTALIIRSLEEYGVTVSFATIASWRENSDEDNQRFWKTANTSLSKNEFVNHSWDHIPPRFTIEKDVVSAQQKIAEQIPGNECLFFTFPGGAKYKHSIKELTDSIRLEEYIGARAGNLNECMNPWNLSDPFRVNTTYYSNKGTGIQVLNSVVDTAIVRGDWGVYSLHNVEAKSWGKVDYETWREHLAYCRGKIDSGKLWVAPVQHVLKYIMERENFRISIKKKTGKELHFLIDTSREINPSALIDNKVYDEPLTLIFDNGHGANYVFNVDPFGGEVHMRLQNGSLKSIRQGKNGVSFEKLD